MCKRLDLRYPESSETGEICFLPFGQLVSSHRFSSILKQQDEQKEEIATAVKVENVLYH